MIKKLTFEETEKMKWVEERSATGGIIPPWLSGCLWGCLPSCQSGIDGDGELGTAFGIIAEPE